MPATRVTIASNANQAQKTVLLIPMTASTDPTAFSSYQSLVLKTAQTKLRLKKANRVFVAGGHELKSQRDWENAIKPDITLLVSAGEDYVGARDRSIDFSQAELIYEINHQCDIVRLNERAEVDSLSLTQLETTARTLPGIIHAVAQPDLHPGTKFPMGVVFVSKGWIHPPLIGGDIGCGMAWYRTTLSRHQVEGDKGRKIAEKLRGLEGPWRSQAERTSWLHDDHECNGESCSARPDWDKALGTIGAGNHFAELQVVEEWDNQAVDRNEEKGRLYEGEVVLLIHSGSRGYGGDVLKHYTKDGRDSLCEGDAQSYLKEHDKACEWASRNRDLIALRFLSVLESGEESWILGVNENNYEATSDEIQSAFANIQTRKVVDIWHNNVEQALWPPSKPNDGDNTQRDRVYIHRKGAAPTYNPTTGLPLNILPLPGSRATPTLILHPTFTAANEYGRSNALSLAHGAGRARSRADAAVYVSEKYKGKAEDLLRGDFVRVDRRGNKKQEDRGGINVNGGAWVVCEDKQLVWEEAGEAYKDVWMVGEDLVGKGCAEKWGWCRGRVCYKVRKE